jgi:hypothetical protein
MKRLLAIALVASLGGCASLQKDWDVLTSATVSPKAVKVTVNSYDALEATATGYLTFCKANRALPVCANYVAARADILPVIRAGRIARDNLETFIQQNPGRLGPSGLYNALTKALATIQDIVVKYSITGVK